MRVKKGRVVQYRKGCRIIRWIWLGGFPCM